MTIEILSYKPNNNSTLSLTTYGDRRKQLRNGDTFKSYESGITGTFQVCRVFYNAHYDESTIVCKLAK